MTSTAARAQSAVDDAPAGHPERTIYEVAVEAQANEEQVTALKDTLLDAASAWVAANRGNIRSGDAEVDAELTNGDGVTRIRIQVNAELSDEQSGRLRDEIARAGTEWSEYEFEEDEDTDIQVDSA